MTSKAVRVWVAVSLENQPRDSAAIANTCGGHLGDTVSVVGCLDPDRGDLAPLSLHLRSSGSCSPWWQNPPPPGSRLAFSAKTRLTISPRLYEAHPPPAVSAHTDKSFISPGHTEGRRRHRLTAATAASPPIGTTDTTSTPGMANSTAPDCCTARTSPRRCSRQRQRTTSRSCTRPGRIAWCCRRCRLPRSTKCSPTAGS